MKIMHIIRQLILVMVIPVIFGACNDDVLQEEPTSFLNSDNTLRDRAGFEAVLTGMYAKGCGMNGTFRIAGKRTSHP